MKPIAMFRKKPIVIEAVRWDGSNISEIREHFGAFDKWHLEDSPYLIIRTLEGLNQVDPGDWIIKGIKGEFYACKPDIFAATYELIEDAGAPVPDPDEGSETAS